jgi:3-phosphoshikimate 1-carboxyvinyltransferase
MIDAWRKVGVPVHHDVISEELAIEGCGGKLPEPNGDIYIANSGTSIRFLAAALAACGGAFRLHGVPRMHQRPIGDLAVALNALGAKVTSENLQRPDCPPVLIESSGLRGGEVQIAGNISSQYLSGLMMASPLSAAPVEISIAGELVSIPYVTMTAAVMVSFGAQVQTNLESETSPRTIRIQSQDGYKAAEYSIEPDASAASYYFAAAAITGGRATVQGLSKQSLQGDVAFCEVLKQMGCTVNYETDSITVVGPKKLNAVDVNMADISDTVQTLAAVAMFADGPTRVTGVAHNRVKETDRISDLATELKRLGAEVEEFEDGLELKPPKSITPASVHTYHDHRMAMSLALVGLRAEGVDIQDPACTGKTYPKYWQDLAAFSGCRIDQL